MLQVDTHEPMEIVRLIDMAVPTTVTDLNTSGWADYRWVCANGKAIQWERKTAQDLLNLDDIELQLARQLQAHNEDRLGLIVEGVFEPAPTGVLIYHKRQGQNSMAGVSHGQRQPGMYKKIMGWLYEVGKYMPVYQTDSMAGTALALVQFYEADQKPESEHKTFQRYFKKNNWHPNPQVNKLIGLAAGDDTVGVVTAERMIQQFGTVWNVIHASPKLIAENVKGLSVTGATQFLRRVGRPDV